MANWFWQECQENSMEVRTVFSINLVSFACETPLKGKGSFISLKTSSQIAGWIVLERLKKKNFFLIQIRSSVNEYLGNYDLCLLVPSPSSEVFFGSFLKGLQVLKAESAPVNSSQWRWASPRGLFLISAAPGWGQPSVSYTQRDCSKVLLPAAFSLYC